MTAKRIAGVLLALLLAAIPVSASEESAVIDQPREDDTYIAARFVDVLAPVRGDLTGAAQHLALKATVTEDLAFAAETITLQGRVGDDARLAARELTVADRIEGHLVAFAQDIGIRPGAAVGGWSRLFAERIDIDGALGGDTTLTARRVEINGTVDGDAEIEAETIVIGTDAHIRGDLLWRSQSEPTIAPGARIDGERIGRPLPAREPFTAPPKGAEKALNVLFQLSLAATAVVLFLLFPASGRGIAAQVRTHPWQALLLGLALLATVPLAALLLLMTALGYLLAFALLALYALALLLGTAAGVFVLADTLLRWRRHGAATGRGLGAAAIAVTLVVLTLLSLLLPPLGGVITFVLLLLGLGGLGLGAYRGYQTLESD